MAAKEIKKSNIATLVALFEREHRPAKKKRKSFLGSALRKLLLAFLSAVGVNFLVPQLRIPSNVPYSTILTIILFIATVLLFIDVLQGQINNMLYQNKMDILARLPVKVKDIFIAKTLVTFRKQVSSTVFFMLPFFMLLIFFNGMAGIYYLLMPLTLAVLFVITFLLGIILAALLVPVFRFLKNKFILQVTLFIALIIGGFFLYSQFLFYLANAAIDELFRETFGNALLSFYDVILQPYTIFGPALRMFNNTDWLFSVLFNLGIIVIGGLIVAGIWRWMNVSYRHNLEKGNNNIFRKRSARNTRKFPGAAIFAKDFKQVMRLSNYSFSYLAIAVATPFVVVLCNMFLGGALETNSGSDIIIIFTLAIILLFTCLTNSFSATAISREGKQFYITKIMPVKYIKQLLSKVTLNFVIAFLVATVSCALVVALGTRETEDGTTLGVTLSNGLLIYGISLLFSIANIFNGLNRNIKRPITEPNEHGEITNRNIALTLEFNIVLVSLLVVAGYILSSFFSLNIMMIFILSVMAAYAVKETLLFFLLRVKQYRKIEK